MDRWSEDELRRVAAETRLSARTIDACRDVLVMGMSGVSAAEKHKMFAAQISRSLTTLREKQADMNKPVGLGPESVGLEQYIASEVARALMGQDFECRLAQPGQSYEGPMLAQSKGFLVQKVGRSGILHPVAGFDHIPTMNTPLTVSYEKGSSKAQVSMSQERSKGIER
ncbi:hypothetical protein [Comamonas testosteroni]|jgi:hypothetical protein|uniref:KfrB domain-containing protein n=1 Tax=Comamonas testosteroni TaxID=285 RepID=UPI0026F1185A|nr:hypothetical protein [Comamonas testosteroni]